ncbi:MAG: hypothetical protein R3B06_25260 [Kofleriaceae bacterium]
MRALAWITLGALVASGCGDDDPPPPPRAKAATPAAAAAAAAARGGPTPGTMTAYAKIEDAPDLKPGEAKTIRRRFTPQDFVPDPTGVSNRDPFRSFVVAQVSINASPTGEATAARAEKCANKKIAAAGYATRELRLIGIISRGTRRVATFADTAGVGWVIGKDDCIGSEHARVDQIGDSYVNLVYPTTPSAADPNPKAEQRQFRLRERELIDEMTLDQDQPDIRTRPRPTIVEPPPQGAGTPGGSQ